ncbi:hypothetical protein [Magnetovibrio sp.]|uniref:hypothetical protein n=1 Tax=Magnetovibrio sp. TaxID=2024836 RepID=UPI002F942E5E
MGAASAKAEVCADTAARTALELRVLQSEFMVSALTCGQRASYNAFVTTFKPYLKKQGGQLRAFFTNAYGAKVGAQKLNGTVTRLANMASQNSLSGGTEAYCKAAETRFLNALKSTDKDLAQMARSNPHAGAHGYKACVEIADRNVAEGDAAAPQGVN